MRDGVEAGGTVARCPWAEAGGDGMRAYHDTEWGVPAFDDRVLFEFLTLEPAQAGLSWKCILDKREGYRDCFAGFDPVRVASFTASDIDRLARDPAIVRNRKKIASAVANARAFLGVSARHGSFSSWYWDHTGGRPIQNHRRGAGDVPPSTPLSEALSRELRSLGFTFLGPVVVYSFMQATGMVNDHLVGCFRHDEVEAMVP